MTYAEIVEMMARAIRERHEKFYPVQADDPDRWKGYLTYAEDALSALSQHIPVREILSGEMKVVEGHNYAQYMKLDWRD